MQDVLFARQPIFDRKQTLMGYELLFRRNDEDDTAVFVDGDHATARVLVNAFSGGGADMLDNKPGFVNLTENLLRSGIIKMLPAKRVVLEILEDMYVDEGLVRQVQLLVDEGYRIALDDFIWDEKWLPLVKMASYIKLDVQALRPAELRHSVAALRSFDAELIAEKVEDSTQMEQCKRMGFDLFQGFYLAKPKHIRGQKIPTSRVSLLQLLARIHDPNLTIAELNQLISRDVGLSFRFLRIVNSAYYSLPGKVESMQHALTLLGLDFTRMWISLIALASIDDKPRELFITAAVRAKMCELLAKETRQPRPEPFYVVGLFSILPALLDAPLKEVLRVLPLDDEVVAALVHRSGIIGAALSCVEAHEQCRWDDVNFLNVQPQKIQEAYMSSLEWASTTQHAVVP
ncbi:MAG: HDOD domain-containing protein [Rhodobacterales bacterium]|nr:HDOD domain-containing protein [Rhodobacterales bacterium]